MSSFIFIGHLFFEYGILSRKICIQNRNGFGYSNEFVTPQQATDKARKYTEKLVDNALKEYTAGNHLQAAQSLVELVLLIVTPISGS